MSVASKGPNNAPLLFNEKSKESWGSSFGGSISSNGYGQSISSSNVSVHGQKERIPPYGATFELRLPEYFSVFQSESNMQIIAERLDAFFNDVYAHPSEKWAALIQETLLFQILSKSLLIEAFLYGDRLKIGRFHPVNHSAKQDWIRPLLRMINVVGLEGLSGVKWSLPQDDEIIESFGAPPSSPSLSSAPSLSSPSSDSSCVSSMPSSPSSSSSSSSSLGANKKDRIYEITDQILLIFVTVLNWVFMNETPEQFLAVLDDVRARFEYLGWTTVNAGRVGSILKCLTTKILRSGVSVLKGRPDGDSCWDNLVVLTNVIEDFSFYSPACGFKRRIDTVSVQPHLDAKGCPDKELFVVLAELLVAVDISNEKSASIGVQIPSLQKLNNKKRRDLLMSASYLFQEAAKWAEVIGDSNNARASDEDEKMIFDRILDQASTELVEALSKRPRFKAPKKQTLAVFASAPEAVLKRQEEEVVHQVGEGRIREGIVSTNWDDLAVECLDKQTKAGSTRLRRTIRFIQVTVEAHTSFMQTLEKLTQEEESKPHADAMKKFSAACDVLPDVNVGVVNQTRLLLHEVQSLVLNPFVELLNEYDRGVIRFKEAYAKEEKAYEAHWHAVLKDFDAAEKDFQELTLCFFEVESAGKGRDAALAKLPKLMQRVVNRFFSYEKLSQDFEQVVVPEHRATLSRLCQELQDVEVKRLESTQLYLERLTLAFSRYNEGLPQLKYCYDELRALSTYRDLSRFSMKSPKRVREEHLPPKLPCSAAGLLAGEGGQGTSPLRAPVKKHGHSSSIDASVTESSGILDGASGGDHSSTAADLEDKSERKKLWHVKAPNFLNLKRLLVAAAPGQYGTSTTTGLAVNTGSVSPVVESVNASSSPSSPVVPPPAPPPRDARTVSPSSDPPNVSPRPSISTDAPPTPSHGRPAALATPLSRKPPKPTAPPQEAKPVAPPQESPSNG